MERNSDRSASGLRSGENIRPTSSFVFEKSGGRLPAARVAPGVDKADLETKGVVLGRSQHSGILLPSLVFLPPRPAACPAGPSARHVPSSSRPRPGLFLFFLPFLHLTPSPRENHRVAGSRAEAAAKGVTAASRGAAAS